MRYLSVVIPAYNEEKRILPTLQATVEFCQSRKYSFELIIVDDGSTDATVGVVTSFAQRTAGISLIQSDKNRGKGSAVRQGMLAASGQFILFQDADGSSPIKELTKLIDAIELGAEVAVGSRNTDSASVHRTVRWHRKFTGNTFNSLVQAALVPGIKDTQCGFKLFTKNAAQNIFRLSLEDGFCFDVEILALANRLNYKVAEIGIDWHDMSGSKVSLVQDSVKMFVALLRIKRRLLDVKMPIPQLSLKSSAK